jgi:3',5'-cyclic AMP phosphodiesterase CpdA
MTLMQKGIRRSIVRCLSCLGLLGWAIHCVHAHDDHDDPVPVVRPAEVYAPGVLPDRIVLSWAEDPKTTQSVTWRTSTDVRQGIAEIAKAERGPYFIEKAKQFKATSQSLKTDINTAHFHSVTFRALKPGTRYAYRVGDGTNWSEWFHFSTANAEPRPFSFVYFGDAQNNIRSMWSRVIREAHRDAPKAAFMLHAGDLINVAEADAEWGEWFGAGAWLNAMVPSVPVPGNHEQARAESGGRRLSHHWRPSFTLPENGPAGLEESCYTFVYSNLRVVGLNSNERQDEQAVWLDRVLSENESQWVACTFHHPIYSTRKDRDNTALRKLWKPIFDRHRVDLVLAGHDHTYGRTAFEVPGVDDDPNELPPETVANVPTGVQRADPINGTVYVVSVSGPKMYNNSRKPFMKRLAEDTQLYQIIHIDGDSLRFEARTAVGELYDAFGLKKVPGERNQFVEVEINMVENLRPLAEDAVK